MGAKGEKMFGKLIYVCVCGLLQGECSLNDTPNAAQNVGWRGVIVSA